MQVRVGIYARVSTTDQTCQQQLTALREYAAARGWTVQGEYVDTGISGSKSSRPAMDRLMSAARARSVDAVVVWKMDRWGRSVAHLVESVRELASLGVRFVATTQGIDTDESNPGSRLMMHMLAAFAEFERELIVERVNAGLARARQQGRIGGRPRSVVDRLKVTEMSAAGMSLSEIAAELGASRSVVHRALRAG